MAQVDEVGEGGDDQGGAEPRVLGEQPLAYPVNDVEDDHPEDGFRDAAHEVKGRGVFDEGEGEFMGRRKKPEEAADEVVLAEEEEHEVEVKGGVFEEMGVQVPAAHPEGVLDDLVFFRLVFIGKPPADAPEPDESPEGQDAQQNPAIARQFHFDLIINFQLRRTSRSH